MVFTYSAPAFLSLPSSSQHFYLFYCTLCQSRATATVLYRHYYSTRYKYFATPFQFRTSHHALQIGPHSFSTSSSLPLLLVSTFAFITATYQYLGFPSPKTPNFDYAFQSPPSYLLTLFALEQLSLHLSLQQANSSLSTCIFLHDQGFVMATWYSIAILSDFQFTLLYNPLFR
jgi:hypothetical protein